MGLGSNLGNKKRNIDRATDSLDRLSKVSVIKSSKYYKTSPWGVQDQDDFLNTVIEIQTSLKPTELLKKIHNIESHLGRVRKEKWGERAIDIDILTFNQTVVDLPHLSIPHPYIAERAFVLAPLMELNPELHIPNKGKVCQLWDDLDSKSDILDSF